MASRLRNPVSRKQFLGGLWFGLVASVVLILAMFLAVGYTNTAGRLLLTALTLSASCFLALAPSSVQHRGNYHELATAAQGVLFFAFILLVIAIWATPDPDLYWKVTAIASISAAALCYQSWLSLSRPKAVGARVVFWVAFFAAALVALLSSIGIIAEVELSLFWWTLVLVAVIAVAGGILAPVLNR